MQLTYKIRHSRDFRDELVKARRIAEFSINHRDKLTSKFVKAIGLKSCISNQILRKYGNNKNCKKISSVNLIVPGQGVQLKREEKQIKIPCLKLELPVWFDLEKVVKVNQVTVSKDYVHVTATVDEEKQVDHSSTIGVDLNAVGHCVVAAEADTGKVHKFARNIHHTKQKYRKLRARAQSNGDYKLLKRLGGRERRIIDDILNKTSMQLVKAAKKKNAQIRLENLKHIRKRSRRGMKGKNMTFTVNSWPFWKFQNMVVYKAKLHGVSVVYVDPAYSSQKCSRCGHTESENRHKKKFRCPNCGHLDHADANAAFNIASNQSVVDRESKASLTRAVLKCPAAIPRTQETANPSSL